VREVFEEELVLVVVALMVLPLAPQMQPSPDQLVQLFGSLTVHQ
jgi:hypothetical protein